MLTSSTLLSSPKLSMNFKTYNPPPPRVRFHLPTAGATAANYYSYTSTQTTTSKSTTLSSSTHRRASCASLYEVLSIPMGATIHDIKTAYRRLARTCHPDAAAAIGPKEDSSADEFIKIHAAYSTLSDPQKRAVYDQNLFRSRRRKPLTARSGYSGRNWETDQCW